MKEFLFVVMVICLCGVSTSKYWMKYAMNPNGPVIEQEAKRASYQSDKWRVSTHVYVYINHELATLEYWSQIDDLKESQVDSVKGREYNKASKVLAKIRL